MNEYDVAVIGGGAAGLSAALVLTRARRDVVVIDAGEPRNSPAAAMHGYLSRDGMAPGDLLTAGRDEVARYGGLLLAGTVSDVHPRDGGGFELTLTDGTTLAARRVLVTTGLRDVIPDVPGLRERWGLDVLHCPYCHGHEVRDQALGVLGGSPEGVAHALLVRQWSDDVVYFAQDRPPSADEHEQLTARDIAVVDGPVARVLVEDDALIGLELTDGTVVRRTAIFVRPGFVPNADLLAGLGCATYDNGWVVADPTGRTSVTGVWVAGNAADPRAQVITAAGEGSSAAIAINADLVDDDVHRAVLQHHTTRRNS
jgi:thioredoxin reductase